MVIRNRWIDFPFGSFGNGTPLLLYRSKQNLVNRWWYFLCIGAFGFLGNGIVCREYVPQRRKKPS